jgi:Glyoxalase-like domain
MHRPHMRVAGPVIGSADPLALAEFYAKLLGWPITDREYAGTEGASEDWARIHSPAGDQKLEFQYEPDFTPPVWPPVKGKQRMLMHLDIGVEDLEAGVAWALETGATVAEHQPQQDVRVMLDPAGHPFCVFPDQFD